MWCVCYECSMCYHCIIMNLESNYKHLLLLLFNNQLIVVFDLSLNSLYVYRCPSYFVGYRYNREDYQT